MSIELIDPDGIMDGGIRLERLRDGLVKEVVFLYPTYGWSHDQERARVAGLEVGRVYRLTRFEIHSYHTRFWLESFGDVWFNSVHFEEAEA